MEWNVYVYNVSRQEMEIYNIFNHRTFVEYIKEGIKECKDKVQFAQRLKSELKFYFWSKAEWEIIIKPWCGNRNPDEVKIDVYDQIMLNWDVFLEYCWQNGNKLLKLEE